MLFRWALSYWRENKWRTEGKGRPTLLGLRAGHVSRLTGHGLRRGMRGAPGFHGEPREEQEQDNAKDPLLFFGEMFVHGRAKVWILRTVLRVQLFPALAAFHSGVVQSGY